MIMKRSVILILFLTTIPDLFAVSYEDSGPYGSVGFSYLVDKYNDGESKRSQDKFLQEYKLGYGGIVYSPKLLDYKAEGILRYENISAKDDGYETKTKVDSKDYNVNLDFIKGSKIPFTVYAQKSEAPVSVVFANGFNRSLGGSESVGISGLVKLDIFEITYSTSNTSEKYESIFSTESRETQTHRTSLRKNEEAYNLQLNYSNINQASERESTEGSSTTTNSLQDKVDL
ncbi:MAG: hypothetical protein QG567_86, partial [Campylobacterota bacterium]|nr:hypothetical protein [Campylobacterota bacterium]